MLTWQKLQTFLTDRDLWLFITTIWKSSRRVLKVSKHIPAFDALNGLIWVNASTKTQSQSEPRCISRCYQCGLGKRNDSFSFLYYSVWQQNARDTGLMCVCLAKMWRVKNQSCSINVFWHVWILSVRHVGITDQAVVPGGASAAGHVGCMWDFTAALCSHHWRLLYVLFPLFHSSWLHLQMATLTSTECRGWVPKNHPLTPFSLLTVREFQTLSIYSMSQQWEHPSHFSKHSIIHFHGTTLKKWHYDK